ncbi:MAG: hypothetical protein AB7T10_09695 [bacterium]
MKKILLFLFVILPFFVFSQTDMADSNRTSIHELQTKAYEDTSGVEEPVKRNTNTAQYLPIAIGAGFIVIYAAVKRRRGR